MTYIRVCAHCGERTTMSGDGMAKSSAYCSNCSTLDKRRKIDEENAAIRQGLGLAA